MEADRFDRLIRSLSTTSSRRKALRFLTGSALGGLLVLEHVNSEAKKGRGKGGGKRKGGKRKNKKCTDKGKTTICHNGQTITVSNCALPAHQAHGDTTGPCTIPGPTCGAFFAECTVGTDCCSGVCTEIPGEPARCDCTSFEPDPNEGTCTTNASCCSGTCDAGECTCHEAGDICSLDGVCCSPLTCQDQQDIGGGIVLGTCQTP